MISIVLLTAVLHASASDSTMQAARVNADAATIADFMKRITEYIALQKRLDGTLQEVKDDARPEQLVEHQRALARLIQNERLAARPGDLWTKPMRDVVRRLLAGIFRGPGGEQIKRSILDEYTGSVRLQVNGRYPDEVPLSSVPPQMLQALPKLPDVLEYRFVGKHLILLDAHARVIVDFVDHVFP
jgi:hypothetical protein